MVPEVALAVDLRVWGLDPDDAALAAASALLSRDEHARAARFATPELTRRWTAARAGMRRILASVLKTEPAALAFTLGPHGRPLLESVPGLSFNLSHCDGLAALAISAGAVVGVDVERVRPIPHGVADVVFSPAELAALASVPEAARPAAFFRAWTAKEAVLKALGSGLTKSGRSFTVEFASDAELRLLSADWDSSAPEGWQLESFEPAPGFAGAVAVETRRPVSLSLHHWAL